MTAAVACFAWLGERARLVLALGLVTAIVLPGAGAFLSGTLPFWVVVLFALSMTRIDLVATARRAVSPHRLARTLGFCLLLMVVTPVLFFASARLAGLPEPMVAALVYQAAAPPLGSAAAFCLLLGLDAALAIEVTVLGSLLAPVLMPLVIAALLDTAVPVDAVSLMVRLAAIIGGGTVAALLIRRTLGAVRIERNARAFDGLSALIMVLFLFPLFEGLPGAVFASPGLAAAVLALVLLANLGVQMAVFAPARTVAGHAAGGAASVMWGNRNAALALAALPGDPVFTLYVALYQIPMYFTPLLMRRLYRP